MTNLVSIKQAITKLAESTDNEIFKKEYVLLRWAMEAENKISHPYKYENAYQVLEVKNYKSEIPLDCVIIDRLLYGKYSREDIDKVISISLRTTKEAIFSENETPFLNNEYYYWHNTESGYLTPYDWTIRGDQIIFTSYIDLEYITIKYRRQPVDEDNIPLVYENHLEAIELYLRIKLYESMEYNIIKSGKSLYNLRLVMNDMKMEFRKLLRYLKQPEYIDDATKDYVANILNDPLSGRGNVLLQNYK